MQGRQAWPPVQLQLGREEKGQCPALESTSSKGHTAEDGHSTKNGNPGPEPGSQGQDSPALRMGSGLEVAGSSPHGRGSGQHMGTYWLGSGQGVTDNLGESCVCSMEIKARSEWGGVQAQVSSRGWKVWGGEGLGSQGWGGRGPRTEKRHPNSTGVTEGCRRCGRGKAGAAQGRAQAGMSRGSCAAAHSASPVLLHAGLRAPSLAATLPQWPC